MATDVGFRVTRAAMMAAVNVHVTITQQITLYLLVFEIMKTKKLKYLVIFV